MTEPELRAWLGGTDPNRPLRQAVVTAMADIPVPTDQASTDVANAQWMTVMGEPGDSIYA